ncbi:CBS domain-containing protein [Candidatus Woesearchaeota archaeon]|nr:CBS domain-containing protein [Candidatus Woesearchaeota archaeon]
MDKSVKIGKIFGIEIDLHFTWFFIFALLVWGLSIGFFPEYYPGLSNTEYWILGGISAFFLFISVLLHELSHSLVAKHGRLGVNKITLFFFGGMAETAGEASTPENEFKMAIAGPLMSFLLAGIFWAIWSFVNIVYVEAIAFYLTILNLILGLFNLAPGYPLDGGRMLRAILWGYYNDIKKATKIASYGGKLVAGVMIIFGFSGFFGVTLEIFGVEFGGLWFAILGFFLYFIAGMSYQQLLLKESLEKMKVKDAMNKSFKTVDANKTLAELFEDYFLRYNKEGIIVSNKKRPAGIVTIEDLKKVPRKQWNKKKIKNIYNDFEYTAKENDNAYNLLNHMSKNRISVVPVVRNRKIIGMVDISSLVRLVKLKQLA